MEYRSIGTLDWKPSALGFGCMRLPTVENSALSPNIKVDEAVEMIRYAIDSGVNYLDTAYFYHSQKSEEVLGKALKDGYRDRVMIADKAPIIAIKTADQFDEFLDNQLRRLGVEKIDFYLLHNLNTNNWNTVKKLDILSLAEKAKKAGKIEHIGFSFHDKYDVFEEVINSYGNWTFCQIQYNFMDTDIQAGTKGLKLAASKGIGVVAMEPLRGGKLANPIPQVKKLMDGRGYKGSIIDLALRWLWSQPEVSVVLSGMTTMEQVKQNIGSACRPFVVSDDEYAMIAEIKKIYDERKTIPCTDCSYCMPCPASVNIPQVLSFYNEALAYDYHDESRRVYNVYGRHGNNCTACKECEAKCPQQIPISEWMAKIDEMFAV